jgi:predicted ATPase
MSAVSEIIEMVLTYDAVHVASIRARLFSRDDGLGENIGVGTQLIPSLSTIVGAQPPPPPMPQAEAQHRLQRTFVQMLRAFATEQSPLVLFVDDLQWADFSSLQLLQSLATNPEFRFCLVISPLISIGLDV